MNAGPRHSEAKPPSYGSMKGPFIASLCVHIAVVVIGAVGLPFLQSERDIIDTPISVELVTIDELTRTKTLAQPQNKPKEIESPTPPQAEPAPPKQTAESPPEPPKPEPQKPKPPKDAEKPPEPEPLPEPKKEPEKKPEPKPEPEKKPEPKPEPKKEPKKEDSADAFSSLLKNLTPDVEDAPKEREPSEEEPDEGAGQIAALSDQLTISELDALKYQIAQCWNVPTGIKYAENLSVEVRVWINRDGTVSRTSVVDKGRYSRDSAFRAAADSAVRALQNPRCSPLKLPADKYDRWKTTVMNFDPRDML